MRGRRLLRYLAFLFIVMLIFSLCYEHEKAPLSNSNLGIDCDTLEAVIAINQSIYSRKGDAIGFNYYLLNSFSHHTKREVDIIQPTQKIDYWQLLANGEIDLLVTDISRDTLSSQYSEQMKQSFFVKDSTAWCVNGNNQELLCSVNHYLSWIKQQKEFSTLRRRFYRKYPTKENLSPYDEIIKREASALGWDWKLLTALIYQESRFSIAAHSPMGAIGLMQVRKSTAKLYNISDVYNPQNNIRAGVCHLKYLQNLLYAEGIDSLNIVKFTLAAYNAGEGRIKECMEFASALGKNPLSWDALKHTIPLMREPSSLTGIDYEYRVFKGIETLKYVDLVLARYEEYRELYEEERLSPPSSKPARRDN